MNLLTKMAQGLIGQKLHMVSAVDVRRVIGYQDFVDTAPMDPVYVVDHSRMKLVPVTKREPCAFAAAGAMAQDVSLYCASAARLFIALWPGPALARSLATLCGSDTVGAAARPVATHSIHLTLNFLGDVPRQRMAELVPALHVPFQPFELSFSRCEPWRHGLVVAIPDAVPAPMVHLHAALNEVLRRLGLPVQERAFRPHLTLARRHFQPPPTPIGLPLRWLVDGYVLAQSGVTPGGDYLVLQRYG